MKTMKLFDAVRLILTIPLPDRQITASSFATAVRP
jgi:hypothetical protein